MDGSAGSADGMPLVIHIASAANALPKQLTDSLPSEEVLMFYT